MDRINLYSDTQTLPTPEMYDAIARCELGDDVLGADPTVNRLEALAAERFGKEAAVLVPSGTMANLVSLMTHGRPGDEVFMAHGSHVYEYEAGAFSSIAGFTPRFVRSERGRMDPDALREAIRSADDHFPRPRLLWLENTHNVGGGSVLSPELQARLVGVARERGLRVHVDGARIFNAAVALGKPVAEIVADVDSVSFCLSKGLSCPIGSLVVGTREFIAEARRARKRVGGGMRQAGIVAASGIVALDTMVDRLAEDHAFAREIAKGLADISGLGVVSENVESNMVFVDVSALEGGARTAQERLRVAGVFVSDMDDSTLRIVTHRGVSRASLAGIISVFRNVAEELSTGS